MESQTSELTLRDLLDVVARRRWVVLGTVLGSVIAAVALLLVVPTEYTAESQVLVQSSSRNLFPGQTALNDRSIPTQIEVIESQAVQDRVQEDLGLDEPPPDVSASAVPQTDVITLAVSARNASDAALYANTYAAAYIEVRREQVLKELIAASDAVQVAIDDVQADIDAVDALESGDDGDPDLPTLADELANFPSRTSLSDQLAEFSTTLRQLRVDAALRTGGTTIIRLAEIPDAPDEPTPARTVPLAMLVGLVLGLGAAFLVDYLDDKIRTEDDLVDLLAFPVLANVPLGRAPDDGLIAISEPAHATVEAYRDLRTNLKFLGLDREMHVIQVTSPAGAEGKTSIAANLAAVLAQAGNRVALVDANLRRPHVHEVLAMPQSPGFTDLLLGADANEVVNDVSVDVTNTLSTYTSGTVPTNPSELLSGQRTRDVLETLRGGFDYVIVDSASVLRVSDAVALSGSVDALLLVVQAGRTTRDQLSDALGRLDQVAAPVVGVVLNQVAVSARSHTVA